MATVFFERQSVARRNTTWLVVMFLLSVVAIIGTTFVAAAVAVSASDVHVTYPHEEFRREHFPWQIPLVAAGAAMAIIVLGSLYKIAEMRGGGTAVAERMGGRRIFPNATDP